MSVERKAWPMSGIKMTHHVCTLGILILLQSCASWNTLQLTPSTQPIFLGYKISPDSSTETAPLEVIKDFQCKFVHESEEGSYSEGRHVSVELGGFDQTEDNIYSRLSEAFEDDTARFIADVQVEIGVRTGISFSNVISSILASLITDNESNIGSYQTEFFNISGTVYRIKGNEK